MALDLKRQSLRISRDLGDAVHTLDSLSRIAFTQAVVGRASLAAELLAASLARHEEAGLPVPLYQQRRRDKIMEHLTAALSASDLDAAFARGRALDLDAAIGLALSVTD